MGLRKHHYKASEGVRMPGELFKILKDNAVKVLHAIVSNLENSAVATGLEKVSFHSNPKEEQCQRMFNCTIVFISHASKVMLKILQARLQQYVNQEIPDVQAGFRRDRRTRDQIANICWIMEKEGNSRKTSASASLTMLKPLTVWITTNCGIFREMGIPDHPTIS